MSKIRVESKDNKLYIYTPYNSNFRKMIKPIGKWNGKAWEVTADKIDDINRMLNLCYGYDADNPESSIDIEVTAKSELFGEGYDGIIMFGRQIASATDRDSGARIGEGVTFLQGSADSSGSRKYWGAAIPEGAVFKVFDVPEGALKLRNEYAEWIDIKPIKTIKKDATPVPASTPSPVKNKKKEASLAKNAFIKIRIDADVKEQLAELLASEGDNTSAFLTRTIMKYLKEHN